MVLKFDSTELNDEGIYRCYAYNSLGSMFKEAMLKFVGKCLNYLNGIQK